MAVLFEVLFIIWVVLMAWAVYHFGSAISAIQEHRHPTHEWQPGDD